MGSVLRRIRKQPKYQDAIRAPQRQAESVVRFVARASDALLEEWRKEAHTLDVDYYEHIATYALGCSHGEVPTLCRVAVKNTLFGKAHAGEINAILSSAKSKAEAVKRIADLVDASESP